MQTDAVKLLGPVDIRELAERLGVRPTKTLGQNFVHDAGSIRKIVAAANLVPGERVLEVGPGLGSLTLGLLEAGHSVVAVEIDPKLAAALPNTARDFAPNVIVNGSQGAGRIGWSPGASEVAGVGISETPDKSIYLDIVQADAMAVTAAQISQPAPTALVANLPYNTAVPILLHLLAELPSLRTALVMVQAEVADRIAATPGSKIYGVPSAKVAWYGRAWRAGNISRNVFWPVPNVDSALVAFERWPQSAESQVETAEPANRRLRRITPPRRPVETPEYRQKVFCVIDAAFAQRRKTLRAALAGLFGSAPDAEAALRACGIDPQARGETLGIEQFTALANQLP